MLKLLKIVGSVFFVFVIIIASFGYYSFQKAAKYETTAVPYIKEVLPKLSFWDVDTFKMYSTPESNSLNTDEELAKLLKFMSKLGSYKGINDIQIKTISNGYLITYIVKVQYENGEATITMQLEDKDGHFLVNQFYMDSWALLE
ncbi:hypothetical protein ACU6U9_17870 [Pseudomonas sp. HK3]